MRFTHITFALLFCAFVVNFRVSVSQLSQETFNIARGKTITASATCGYDLPPGQDEELFCKLATVPGKYGIDGLECGECNPKVTSGSIQEIKDHRIEYAIDGTEKWWQSPPLSRGLQYNEINITIDLDQAFHVVYVVIKTANSPRPGTWILERSIDFGQTYTPWYYFAPSRSDCLDLFKINPRLPLRRDDQVLCVSRYSQIPPFENGEMYISLVNDRPSALQDQFSPALQEWMKATNVRLRLLRAKTLLGEYLPLAKGDPTVTRRYFYSIKDITIGGLCICNGYADQCIYGPSEERTFCRCQKNTCGPSCSECCPGYHQYKWKSGFEGGEGCEACNCHGHSDKCYYSALVEAQNGSINLAGERRGGGVCIDCQDNTIGNNCEYCKHKFYNPTGRPMTNKDACVPCNCNEQFSTGRCFNGDGQCECKANYAGKKCDQCSVGYYDFPDCKPCQCNPTGTQGGLCEANGNRCPCKDNYAGAKCDQCARGFYNFPQCVECQCDERGSYTDVCEVTTGDCTCLPNFKGRTCNQCADGYYGYPSCRACSCDVNGVTNEMCDEGSGTCICKPEFSGTRCDNCATGYFGYPSCQACQCSGAGSTGPECDGIGRCSCKPQYAGPKCDRCAAGYYEYPRCVPCSCDRQGSLGEYCQPDTGQCQCKENFSGTFCNYCKPGFYGFPNCEECGCDPAGVRPLPGRPLGDCSSSNTGQCECKRFVQGKDCSECKPKTFNLTASNPYGCQECRCNVAGVIGGIEICDEQTGRCLCKDRVTSKRCEICKDGYYKLRQSNAFGCSGCNCDVGGSYSHICGKYTGQCNCRPNVGGRACDRPLPKHYHADLFQLLSEIEDGRTPDNRSVRFRYSEQEFPGYSWRGYGVFSDIQRSVIVRVNAKWPENYHMVFHYVLNDDSDATGEVVVRRVGGNKGVTQRSAVIFKPTVNGSDVTSQFVVVAENGSSTQFAMLDRHYDIQFTTDSNKLLLDYVSIVPVFYPGPSQVEDIPEKRSDNVLEEIVTRACEVNGENRLDDLCVQYSFVGVNKPGFVRIQAEEGYVYDRTARRIKSTQVFSDAKILKELDFSALALLDRNQSRLSIRKKVPKTGKYVVLVQYFTTKPNTQFLDLYMNTKPRRSFARFRLPSCKYTFGCRTVGLTVNGAVQTVDLKADVEYELMAVTNSRGSIAVDSFILVPYEKWVTDYIVPSKLCVTRMKVCTRTSYSMPGDAVMVEAGESGDDQNNNKPPNIFDPSALLVYLEGEDSFDKEAIVPTSGDYAIMVHYYQPYHTTVESETAVSSVETRRGTTSFKYCPNTSGCRTVVKRLDGGDMFKLGNKVALNFKLPNDNNLWIDYILIVPKASYSPLLASGEPVDRTNDFVEHCSKDNLHVTKDGNEFCTNSVFSLSTFYNNGSFPCECDTQGSRSDTCDVFGGQCSCFENIIGRACTRCKTGYYGFPNCRKCDCDYCDPDTGVCECPPNTAGADCTCVKGTFGYDPVQGCLACDCDPTGVTDASGSCDATSGQCSCLPSRAGRRCDQCKPGYYDFPNCKKCDCNEDGITGCDPETGRCTCKEYVAGTRCDLCKIGYFYLNGENPKGCLECWCSGQTNQCDIRSNKISSAGSMTGNWTLQNGGSDKNATSGLYYAMERGDMTSLYGGVLLLAAVNFGEASDVPLALIENNGEQILYTETVSSLAGQNPEVSLTVNKWKKDDGLSLTRDEFMRALVQVDLLHVLAPEPGAVFQVPSYNSPLESPIEECICPSNTTGLSCQECSVGYFRSGEACIPCQCNGHSSSCDPKTGECYDCQHETTGLRCEKCIAGYYGDPTSGEADACQRCPCPDSSKNYATSCFQELDGSFNCTCRVGYTGKLCNECADGYFGDPLTTGCKPCECNGNIDLASKGNCDRHTGECLRCVNNTGGKRCEKCQPGYFGNGSLGNCQRCKCDMCGSASSICNEVTGECSCKPGVTGLLCTVCQSERWDFHSCNGCQSCKCSGATLNNDCNPMTGQCDCKPGVTGLKCDTCDDGFFGYTDQGCQACNCPTGQVCDISNGKCCDPGDSTCQICPPYHIRTADGCEYCGPCEERLFKRVDKLLGNYSTGGDGEGIATDESKKRLNNTEIILKDLKDRVNLYNTSITILTNVVIGKDSNTGTTDQDLGSGVPTPTSKPNEISLEEDATKLNDEGMNIVDKAMDVNTRSDKIKKNATKTKEDAYDIEEKLKNLLAKNKVCPAADLQCIREPEDRCEDDSSCSKHQLCCQHVCEGVTTCRDAVTVDLKDILRKIKLGNANSLEVLKKIEEIRHTIESRNYSTLRSLVESELNASREALSDSELNMIRSKQTHDSAMDYEAEFGSLEPIFRNQLKKAASSLAVSRIGEKINEQASLYEPDAIILHAKTKKEEADFMLVKATDDLTEAKRILESIKFPNTSGNTSILSKYLKIFDQRIANLTKENALLRILVNNATDHANNLKNLSDFLQSLLSDPNKYAEKALKAARSYENVVKAIEELLKLAREANDNSKIALDLSKGLGVDAANAKNTSVGLENAAENQKKKIPELADWLDRLAELIKQIRDNFEKANKTLTEVKKPFPVFEDLTSKLGGRTKEVEEKAKTSESDSKDAKAVVDKIEVPGIEPLEEGYENAVELLDRIEKLANENDDLELRIASAIENVKRNHSETEALIEAEVIERIQRIRFNIERGRDKIREYPSSAGNYTRNTSMELKIPEVAYGPSSQTQVSFKVATDQNNALILFMGSPQEYLAFEVNGGKLQIVSGEPKEVLDTGLDIKKGDADWRNVEFVRTGPNVEVKVGDDLTFSGNLQKNQFELKRGESYLFVGAPPKDFKLPADLKNTTLLGGFDQLFVDGRGVGLYDALNYNSSVVPRQLAADDPKTENVFQFFGNQYLGFKRNDDAELTTKREIDIKTVAKDGLILFLPLDLPSVQEKSYAIVEMLNGTVGFRVKLAGKDVISAYTSERFDDNENHKVVFQPSEDVVKLTVDDKNEIRAPGQFSNIYLFMGRAYVGGFSRDIGYHKTIKTPFFFGCIGIPEYSGWDYWGIDHGCDNALVTAADFSGRDASLEISQPVTLSSNSQISSMFKSTGDGLLMSMENEDGTFMSLGIEDGELKFDFNLGGDSFGNVERRRRRSAMTTKLNDNKWHSYSLRLNNGILEIVVDDEVVFKKVLSPKATASLKKAFKVSFGGVKDKKKSKSALVRQSTSLTGEMRDPLVVDNGKAKMLNFGDAKEKSGVDLGERPAPYFNQPVALKVSPEVLVTTEPTTTMEITTVSISTMISTAHDLGSGTSPVDSEVTPAKTSESSAIPPSPTKLTTSRTSPTEPTTTPTTLTESTTTPTPTTPTEPTTTSTTPTTPTEPTTTPTTPTEPTTTPTTPTEPTTTPTTPTEPPTTPTTPPTTPTEPTTTPTTPTEPTTTPTTATEPTTTPTAPLFTTVTPSASKTHCSPTFEYSNSMAVTGTGYAQYKVTRKGFGLKGGLSFEFRTFASNGILFYSADKAQKDFISCYLQDGKVTFGFNTGSGDLFLSTDNVVNDGTWKKVTIYRDKVKARLWVDGVNASAVGKKGPTFINGISHLYFGGYFREVGITKINEKSRVPISACFRGLEWHGGEKFPIKPRKQVFVSRCYNEPQEKSVYFSGANSYMVAAEGFYVGRKRIFSMELKPRNLTGLIFAVVPQKDPTKEDFVVLELNQGSVVARVQNGDGVIEASWTPPHGTTLCDNKWHTIILSKVDSMVSLQIDKNPPAKAKKGRTTVANVKDSFFLGGVPETVQSDGLGVRSSYQGCLRNFRIKMSSVIELSNPVTMFGDISMFGCPIVDSN